MSLFRRSKDQPSPLDYSGSDEIEVKGEAAYQDNFVALVGTKREGGYDVAVTATLRREPTNRYDPNAVAVYVEGRLLGYVNRDDSAGMSLYLSRIEAAAPGRPVEVAARIVGGWDRGRGAEGHYGLRVFVDRHRLRSVAG